MPRTRLNSFLRSIPVRYPATKEIQTWQQIAERTALLGDLARYMYPRPKLRRASMMGYLLHREFMYWLDDQITKHGKVYTPRRRIGV